MNKDSRGQSIVEIILAVALTAIILPGLLTGFLASREGKAQKTQRLTASALLREGVDAVRSIREKGWNSGFGNLAPGDYHPAVNAADNTWKLDPAPELVGNYTRTITLADVYRDGSNNIADTGTLDPSTKKATIAVSWQTPRVSSVDTTLYLTRYLDNASFTQTLNAHFNLPGNVQNNVVVANDEITLTPAGPGTSNWCDPSSNIITGQDLPRNGEARSLTAIPGEAFAATGANASGVSLARVLITDTDPPTTSIPNGNTFDGYKTNDVFGETGFAYLATDNNSKEVVIVSTSTTPFSEIGSFNIQPNAASKSIFVLGRNGFVIGNNKLIVFDLSAKTGVRVKKGEITLTAQGNSVYVVDIAGEIYAFVATNSNTTQMQIVRVFDNSTTNVTFGPLVSFNVPNPGARGGKDIYVSPDGNRAYLATASSGNQQEFFIVNTQNKSAPVLASVSPPSSYDTNGMDPNAVDMVLSGNRAIIVGSGGNGIEEYQVVDIRDEAQPTRCGGLENIGGNQYDIYDVATVIEPSDLDVFAYIVTSHQSAELKIIEGGGNGEYATMGTYESAMLPGGLSSDAAFNRFKTTFQEPNGSNVQFYTGAGDKVGGNCPASLPYQGPFPDGAQIPMNNDGSGYENPSQCFRYKVELFPSTDFKTSPVFQDITVNYTP